MAKGIVDADAFAAEALAAFDGAAREMGIEVPRTGRELIEAWLRFFVTWKGRRVAGFEDPRELGVKLLADSFAIAFAGDVFPVSNGVDVGSGNGWPGLALAALGVCTRVSLLDSRQGACEFLDGFVQAAELSGVDVVHARAEEAGRDPDFREKYCLTVARAVAVPGILLELCSGLVSAGGYAVLWLGPGQPAPRSAPGLSALGLELEREISYLLPWDMGRRVLAVYRKVRALDDRYPRGYARINKKPLI